MPKLIITRGLPASGKTTWAKTLVSARAKTIRVNRDDIRVELGIVEWSPEREKEVIKLRNQRIEEGLEAGLDVISDDTNLALGVVKELSKIAKNAGAEVEFQDFLDVPIETCIERDALREGKAKVGEAVIRDMHKRHLIHGPSIIPYEPKPLTQQAIICDLDGTAALHNGRSPFEYDKCDTDLVNYPVREVLRAMSGRFVQVIYLSGREDSSRTMTQEWLDKHMFPEGPLFMRKANDYRKDNIVKYEIFNNEIRDKYTVLFTLDDRDQVVKMWRDLGLTCLQVAYGAF